MIKKLIFDIDNTLIMWKEEYSKNTVIQTYKNLNLNYNNLLIDKTNEAINNYEKKHSFFYKNILLNDINNFTNQNLCINFIDEYLKNCIQIAIPKKLPNQEISTLKYLYSKYELIALTNWFSFSQIERLKKVDIYKYFQEVIGADKTKVKPNKESFLAAVKNNKPEECCMIGDNLETDIKGALNSGLSAVYLTSNPVNLKNCICIDNFQKLNEIL